MAAVNGDRFQLTKDLSCAGTSDGTWVEVMLEGGESWSSVRDSHEDAEPAIEAEPLVTSPSAPSSVRYDRLQAVVFLLVLPLLNMLLMSSLFVNLEVQSIRLPLLSGLRIWITFGLSFVLLRVLGRLGPRLVFGTGFLRQLLVHASIVITVGYLIGPLIEIPPGLPQPKFLFAPRMIVVLELGVYLAVVRILNQQERWFATAASLREAELNVLRSQSNPHFLFNTLNLIASEISVDPDNAKEIVYDLADLLRSSVKAAQKSTATVEEEMELVRLYLSLQQQRFSDRLSFSIDVAPTTAALEVPSLLLQPVVENTVKWAVAPYAKEAAIQVRTELLGETLSVTFDDTGPSFDVTEVVEGSGLRILRRTLEIHHPGRWSVRSSSIPGGGRLCIQIPARPHVLRSTSQGAG